MNNTSMKELSCSRSDNWRWFLIEVAIRLLNENGYELARALLVKHKFDPTIIDRVLDCPEQRRIPLEWGSTKK